MFTIDPTEHNVEPNVIVFDVSSRDKRVEQLKHVLQQRKQQMLQNYKVCNGCTRRPVQTSNTCHTNTEQLLEIVGNYKQYYLDQISRKKNQVASMQNIHTHLDEIVRSGPLSDGQLLKMKREQAVIFNEIASLDRDIETLSENL